jgi:molybdate transport system substrate-binding protein
VRLGTILIILLACAAWPRAQEAPILVSAAISLTDALQEVAAAYERSSAARVRFNFAGSNVLARQIVNGAPADLFISADASQMDYAQGRGAIDAATRIDLLYNRLVVVVPRDRGATVSDPQGLLALSRIAVGDPAAVPAGVYARQFLERAGIWAQVQSRLVPLTNVRAALVAAESGGVDAAIVYASDAATSDKVLVAYTVTGALAPDVVYPAALVSRSTQKPAAAAFLAFLRSAAAQAIFARYHFIPATR